MSNYEERKKLVDVFTMTKAKFFPAEHLPYIKEKMMNASEHDFLIANSSDYKDPMVMLIVSIIGGSLGIDRFLLGEIGLGILKLLTAGGCGVWTIIDWFIIMNKTREANLQKLLTII